MLKYREYDIQYNDGTGGVTIYRNVPSYGAAVSHKKVFSTLEDGLSYIAERIAITDNSEISGVLVSLRTLKNDLKNIIYKIHGVSKDEFKTKEIKEGKDEVKEMPRNISLFKGTGDLEVTPRKVIKKK